MKGPRSLRSQLTAGAALLVAAVVAVSGVVIAVRIEHQDRAQVDRQLLSRAKRATDDADKLLSDHRSNSDPTSAYGNDDLLGGTGSVVRVLSGDRVVVQRGDRLTDPISLPSGDGFSTVHIGSQDWRSLVLNVGSGSGERVQVLQTLQAVEQRRNETARIVAIVAAAATIVTALGAWLLAGLLLRPLERLREGAATIRASTEVDQRLPVARRPLEVADLSATLNEMLRRLQTSMLATRRFTADAGHELRTPLTGLGMDIETLRHNPSLSGRQRDEVLAAMTVEHQRIVRLLDGLQQLARGDAGALPGHARIDLWELVVQAVNGAGRRHPTVTFGLSDDVGEQTLVDGWADGLRLALDNLLDNAALHGRPGGVVDVQVSANDGQLAVSVLDDGPGIPAAEQDVMRERFRRGARTSAPGSGLGLALVEQQALLHGGTLTLSASPTGGLKATLVFPAVNHNGPPA